jgi:hypothetical protein
MTNMLMWEGKVDIRSIAHTEQISTHYGYDTILTSIVHSKCALIYT